MVVMWLLCCILYYVTTRYWLFRQQKQYAGVAVRAVAGQYNNAVYGCSGRATVRFHVAACIARGQTATQFHSPSRGAFMVDSSRLAS